jgi:hypothetical protein
MTAPIRTTQLQNLTAGQPAEDDRLGRSAFTPSTGLHSRTGIWPAPAGYAGEVTLLSNTQLQVNPFRATIAGTQSGVQGDYTVTSDTVRTLTIGAAHATLGRIDLVVSRVRDTGYTPNEGANDFVPPSIIAGTPAATPAAPATPANSLVHGTLTVPAAGAAVTFTPGNPGYSVALGGIRPALAADTANGPHDGAYRDHATLGLQRWSAARTRWEAAGGDWNTVALGGAPAWTSGASATVSYRIVAGICFLQSAQGFTGSFAAGANILPTPLPTTARPKFDWYFLGLWYGNTTAYLSVAAATGQLTIQSAPPAGANGLILGTSYPVG